MAIGCDALAAHALHPDLMRIVDARKCVGETTFGVLASDLKEIDGELLLPRDRRARPFKPLSEGLDGVRTVFRIAGSFGPGIKIRLDSREFVEGFMPACVLTLPFAAPSLASFDRAGGKMRGRGSDDGREPTRERSHSRCTALEL